MAYLSSYKDQNWLIPQSIKDMIPKEHASFFVEEFIESLDFSNFDELYDGAGHPSYHPRILMYYDDDLKKKRDVLFYFRERLRMRDKMITAESKEVYRLRKCTVEPVIGNIKQNLGFREFMLKGLDKVKIELNLMCIAHNLQNTKKSKISCAQKMQSIF